MLERKDERLGLFCDEKEIGLGFGKDVRNVKVSQGLL